VFEIGVKPSGLRETSKDTNVNIGDIYGTKQSTNIPFTLPPGSWSDEAQAKKLWNLIETRGDKPLYVKVNTNWMGFICTYLEIEFYAVKQTAGTDIGLIILGIAAVLGLTTILINQVYYILTKEEIPGGGLPGGKEGAEAIKAVAIVAGLGIGAYILFKIVKPEEIRERLRR
jgi:hypothetical protein